MSNTHETFSRVIKTLDSVPGVHYDFTVQPFIPLCVDLVFWRMSSTGTIYTVVTKKQAEEITDEELASLAIELTFGQG
jgi:hypothetical protein